MDRRGFLSFLIAAPVTRSLPWKGIAKVLAPVAPVVSARIVNLTFTRLITETFRKNRHLFAANVQARNALLRHLAGQ